MWIIKIFFSVISILFTINFDFCQTLHVTQLNIGTKPRKIILKSSFQLFLSKGLGSKGSDELFYCQQCGVEHIKWVGRCSSCQTWNSVKLFKPAKHIAENRSSKRVVTGSWTSSIPSSAEYSSVLTDQNIKSMDDIAVTDESERISLFSDELNRVLGGGLVKGSVVLCAGEPGVGKSTLFMQIASQAAASDVYGGVTPPPILYISGEENENQIVNRAKRLGLSTNNIYLHCEVDVDVIGNYTRLFLNL
jgi:DNA repair protein RadA/Sms